MTTIASFHCSSFHQPHFTYHMPNKNIAIIGGGAAGCFAAIHIKTLCPTADVTVYEGGSRLLAKVAITGGGRCNLTNSFNEVKSMETAYPRGARLMKRLMRQFDHHATCQWFEQAGVPLVTQDDQCVFPASQDAMQIVHTLQQRMAKLQVKVKTGHRLSDIEDMGENYLLHFDNAHTTVATLVLITTGGSSSKSLQMLAHLHLDIVTPVASLFSFCLPQHPIRNLMGTVVNEVGASITGTKMRASGPLLITHWGLSGPAILKLSAYGAQYLHEHNYQADIAINWCGGRNAEEVAAELHKMAVDNPQKQLQNIYPTYFTNALWVHLLDECKLRRDMRWAEMGRKGLNRLTETLTNHHFHINGKNRFKDEFVTCGGVALSNVKANTLECVKHPRLFFAGEVLDVDAITGGFNLQAAWTMGYVAAKSMGEEYEKLTS